MKEEVDLYQLLRFLTLYGHDTLLSYSLHFRERESEAQRLRWREKS